MADAAFSMLSDDVVLTILFKLQEDPRNWARLACVCTRFLSLIREVCCKQICIKIIPDVCDDLLSASSTLPGGWAALHKVSVCCPGLLHSGVLLEHSDFGLQRELGPDEIYHRAGGSQPSRPSAEPCSSKIEANPEDGAPGSNCPWSLYDDLYFDTVYNASESQDDCPQVVIEKRAVEVGADPPVCKRRKICQPLGSHLACGIWNLSREQGSKLLASRFRGDCLYVCYWPGCVHAEEKRNYMLFRGIFKNFKSSRVWRTINDGKRRSKTDLNCAFCSCKETWDLHSAFCLKRGFGFHDDGEPVVRAYVCENGHVSGAWTEWPLYT